jgi:subtilase family serine protease
MVWLMTTSPRKNQKAASGRNFFCQWSVLAAGLFVIAGGFALAGNASTVSASNGPKLGPTADCNSITTCFTPPQLQVAYGVAPLLAGGVNGRGETVVLPELAYSQPSFPEVSDLRQDFKKFDGLFRLPKAKLRFVTTLAKTPAPWLANGEEVLDAEVVHAIAPDATITVLLVKSSSLNNPTKAVAALVASLKLATSEGGVVSISAAGQTGGEHCDSSAQVAQMNSALQEAVSHRVTVVAASGDVGAVGEPCAIIKGLFGGSFPPVKEVNLPAASPWVLGVGGTTLSATHQTGAFQGETAWGLPYGDADSQFQASGGGFSTTIPRPSYQSGVAGIGAYRGVPDVSADASPHTGMALVISDGSNFTIRNGGGTSESAPLWAGIIALADQYAGRHLGLVNPALYQIGRSGHYSKAFHDVTTGNNTPKFSGKKFVGYSASPGWDPVTGWGSPNAQVLVPLLAHYDKG